MAMRRPVVLVLVLVLALAPASLSACLPGGPPRTTVVSFNIGARERFLTYPATEETRLAALADQASRDLGCPAPAIRSERRKPEEYAVVACGKRGVYLAVMREGNTRAAPGFEGTEVRLDMIRFVLLSGDDGGSAMEALARADAPASDRWFYLIPGQADTTHADEPRRVLSAWIALNQQGARDLSCPRGEVVVEWRRLGRGAAPVAEGCGKRAVYLPALDPPFDLASTVPVNGP